MDRSGGVPMMGAGRVSSSSAPNSPAVTPRRPGELFEELQRRQEAFQGRGATEQRAIESAVEQHRAQLKRSGSGPVLPQPMASPRHTALATSPILPSVSALPPPVARAQGEMSNRPPPRPAATSIDGGQSSPSISRLTATATLPWHAGKLFMRVGSLPPKKFKLRFVTLDESRLSWFKNEKDGKAVGWLELKRIKCVLASPNVEPPPEAPPDLGKLLVFSVHVFSRDGFEEGEWSEWECCALSEAEKTAWLSTLRQNVMMTRGIDVLEGEGSGRGPLAERATIYRCIAPFEPSDVLTQLSLKEGELVELVRDAGKGWLVVRRAGRGDQGHAPKQLLERVP